MIPYVYSQPAINFDQVPLGQYVLTFREDFATQGCHFPYGSLAMAKNLRAFNNFSLYAFTLKSGLNITCPFGTHLRMPVNVASLGRVDFLGGKKALEPVPPWATLYAGTSQHSDGQSFTLPTTNANIIKFQGLDFVQGKASWFGGKNDDGVGPFETGALMPETPLRSLGAKFLGVALRLDYSQATLGTWAKQRVVLVNPATHKVVVAPIIDWGPAKWTGRAIDVTPGVAMGLGYRSPDDITDRNVLFAFAPTTLEPGIYDIGQISGVFDLFYDRRQFLPGAADLLAGEKRLPHLHVGDSKND